MELQQVTFQGPPIDDPAILGDVPLPLANLLRQVNGMVQYHGGLHLRGACLSPAWHSLREAWRGPAAFRRIYQSMSPTDVPFAEDCVGDQFLLRDDAVWKLMAETDEATPLGVSLTEFLQNAQRDPVEYLGMHPLMQFMKEQGQGLAPGQLLAAYPPYCTAESAAGVDLRAISTAERHRFLMEFAVATRQMTDGAQVVIKTRD